MNWKSKAAAGLLHLNLLAGGGAIAQTAEPPSEASIVAAIQTPKIPSRQFVITSFGAKAGADARPAILKAIAAASKAGGGRVVVPAGAWTSKGPIVLRSRIELHLAQGATVLFSPDPADYLPMVKTRWEGTEVMGYSPLIYGRDVEDVAITGPGVLDGNAQSAFHGWAKSADRDMQALRRMGFSGVAVEQRQMGAGHFLRPSMVQMFGAKRVLLQDYTIRNSPFWVNHLVYTDHAVVRNLTVDSRFANNDGVDVDSSRYVLVENNRFHTGDDSVVVKSGRDADGRKIARPSEYVVVRHNDMGGEDGIALGSEMSGDVRYVFFSDNILRKGASAIRFKANLDRGGVVEHIVVRNMKVESFDKLFWFQLDYPGELGGNFPSTYRDIVFENLDVASVGTVLEAHAPPQQPLTGVTFRNVRIAAAKTPFVLENVKGLTFENLQIGGQRVDGALSWTAPAAP